MASDELQGSTMAALMAASKPESTEVKQPSNQATTKATKQPKKVASDADTLVETIRKAVKLVGKETTSYRLHEVEKESLDDIIYGLKKRGFRSSENEIMRIAINYVIDDYNQHSDDSVLIRVLESLKA